MKCFVNVNPVLFIGFSQFYWVYKAVVRAAGGGLTLTLNSPPLSLHCQLFAMSLPDICHWHTWPRRSLPGLATVSQAWPMAMSLPDFYMSTESQAVTVPTPNLQYILKCKLHRNFFIAEIDPSGFCFVKDQLMNKSLLKNSK